MSFTNPEEDHLGEARLPHHPLFKAVFTQGPYRGCTATQVGDDEPGIVHIIKPDGHSVEVNGDKKVSLTKELLNMTDYFKELQRYLKRYPSRKSELEKSAKREGVDFNAWLRGDTL